MNGLPELLNALRLLYAHDASPLSLRRLIAFSVLLRILCEGVLIVIFMVYFLLVLMIYSVVHPPTGRNITIREINSRGNMWVLRVPENKGLYSSSTNWQV